MPEALLTALPQLASIVEKLGIIGLLIAAVIVLIWERRRLMQMNVRTFKQRDRARMISERYRSALTAGSVQVPDTADIDLLLGKDEEE